MSSNDVQVRLTEASSQLRRLQQPLTKVQPPAPAIPLISAVQGKTGAYGEVTRAHRSVFLSDAGDQFSQSRFASEVYPIPGPLCDMRALYQVVGAPSRAEGRDPYVIDA